MSKIFYINLSILIVGNILFCILGRFFFKGSDYPEFVSMIFSIYLIIAQVALNLIAGVVCLIMKIDGAKYFMLSILIVILVGVPLCFGGAYITSLTR